MTTHTIGGRPGAGGERRGTATTLKSPYPYFGGKSRVADLIWSRFGDAPNYVEPFFGSGAVLLQRPHPPKTETVNDLNAFICNFWRAVKHDPAAVAEHCSFPVNENHLHSVHRWLVLKVGEDGLRAKLDADPDYFDPLVAGRWVWGACAWIGSGWCSDPRKKAAARNAGQGINRQLPHVGDAGRGIHRKLPHVGDAGRGIHRKLPHVGDAGRGAALLAYIEDLSARLHGVRVCCGEWDRVLGPSVTFRHGITAVFLDPPYAEEAGRADGLYANDDLHVSHAVREWAIANGTNRQLRICLAGYEGEHDLPESWECVEWKTRGGYGSQRQDGENENPHKERLWFSPYCIKPARVRTLFDALEEAKP
jgi:site-specific DNA-adenine methylase